jgi:hypothetical protein
MTSRLPEHYEMPMSGDDEELEAFFAAEENTRDAGMSDQEHGRPEQVSRPMGRGPGW